MPQANFPAHNWTEGEGDKIESRLPFKIFSTLSQSCKKGNFSIVAKTQTYFKKIDRGSTGAFQAHVHGWCLKRYTISASSTFEIQNLVCHFMHQWPIILAGNAVAIKPILCLESLLFWRIKNRLNSWWQISNKCFPPLFPKIST